jgi:hypothetical protein
MLDYIEAYTWSLYITHTTKDYKQLKKMLKDKMFEEV